jgi:hypothetical protein
MSVRVPPFATAALLVAAALVLTAGKGDAPDAESPDERLQQPRLTVDQVCPELPEGAMGAHFELVHESPAATLFHGRRQDGTEFLLQPVPSYVADAEPRCETWAIGRELAAVEARLVPDGPKRQRVSLHESDLPGMTGVLVARDAVEGRTLAAGPFFLFCTPKQLDRRDLGMGHDLVGMRCVRPNARAQDEHGVSWHDAGEHLLISRNGLIMQAVKSVGMAPRWLDEQGRRCEATPPYGLVVLDRGERPRLLGLDMVDVPGWSRRLLRGEPFDVEIGGYTWALDAALETFLVEPPHRRERIPWRVEPRCR